MWPVVAGGIAAVGIILALPSSGVPWHEQRSTPATKVEGQSSSSATVAKPIYKPQKRGAPGGRVGAGTRGVGPDRPVLSALAPDHTGLTVHEQSTVYWYLSQATDRPISVKIISEQSSHPLVHTTISPPIPAGILAIPLAQYGAKLVTGVRYHWLLELGTDSVKDSPSLWAGGTIERVELLPELLARLEQSAPSDLPALYAEEGLWYDALDALSEMIQAAPDDVILRKHRGSLLEQVGLDEAAAHDFRR